jgi:hypothetical protein
MVSTISPWVKAVQKDGHSIWQGEEKSSAREMHLVKKLLN